VANGTKETVQGIIYKIVDNHLVLVDPIWPGATILQHAGPSSTTLAFTLNKIAGYRGETPEEMGLRVGSRVTLKLSPTTGSVAGVVPEMVVSKNG
jgi:hypothetical protein